MKNTLLTFALICSMVSSHAAGVYSALVPDQADTHVLVTLIDRACDSTNGNATVRNPNKSLKGCWVQDGLTFRVSIHETNEVLIFPRSEFKYMGDPALSAAPKKQAESSFATTLTCVADGWTGRRLTKSSNKMKIGASVLLGDEDEEVEVHGEPDCDDIGRGRRWVACG